MMISEPDSLKRAASSFAKSILKIFMNTKDHKSTPRTPNGYARPYVTTGLLALRSATSRGRFIERDFAVSTVAASAGVLVSAPQKSPAALDGEMPRTFQI